MRKNILCCLLLSIMTIGSVNASNYIIDTKGAHAFVQFRIKHLGYSWLYGRFDKFSGEFNYDESAPEKSKISVTIDTTSLNSNHAERDKHLRGSKYLNVEEHPEAKFISTTFIPKSDETAELKGNLTLNGVTKEISVDVTRIGGGKDPWGGYRQGFTGSTTLTLKDFGYTFNLGPASQEVELILDIEGIRQ